MLNSVSRILTGNVIAQAISILALPIVSRIYSPNEYGTFGVVLAVVALLAAVVTFQMQQAIVLPRLDAHGFGLFILAVCGALAGGTLVLILSIALTTIDAVDSFWDSSLCVLLALAVASTGVGQSIVGLVIRAKAFTQIGVASILRVSAIALAQIGLGLSGAGAHGLVLGYILGEIVAGAFLWWRAVPKIISHHRHIRWKRQFALTRRFRDFATFGTAQEAMNSASQGIPVVLLGIYFGQASAGYYAFAIRILSAPGQMIANSVRQVASRHFAEVVRSPIALLKDFRSITLNLAVPTLLCAFLVLPWLPEAFVYLFGEPWRESGTYGKWLIVWLAFLVFNAPSTVVIRTLRRQKESFLLNVLILGTRTALLVWGGMYWEPAWTVGAFAALGVFWSIVYIGLAWHFIPKQEA